GNTPSKTAPFPFTFIQVLPSLDVTLPQGGSYYSTFYLKDRPNIGGKNPALGEFRLEKSAEAIGLDVEMHVRLGSRHPVFGYDATQIRSQCFARSRNVESKRREPVCPVHNAITLHSRVFHDAGKPVPFSLGELIALVQNRRIMPHANAEL